MLHALFHDLGKGYPGDRTETGPALSAEIGSHFEFYREPDIYDRRIYNFLNFLHM